MPNFDYDNAHPITENPESMTQTHQTANRRFIFMLALSVFLTGFSALLYQVVWQRMLGLFSGSDVRSVTIVTSAFLAGLGVGSL
ncbi:MAG TPA: hypothetical protein VJZ27_10555, partial [Aggregatilineales bacterium]|nr:hypothetical protein [Aggregatilineales bacterium]